MTSTRQGALRDPLTVALSSRAKVGSLRILSLIHEPITQRELARRARFQHRSVQLALEELVAIGLVARIEGGRDFLVRLNRDHRLASPIEALFREEAEHFLELRRTLIGGVGSRDGEGKVSLALFGSVARAEDSSDSDVDLLVIAPDAERRERALRRLDELREDVATRFGVRLRAIGYTRTEARRLWSRNQPPLPQAFRDGVVLLGPPLKEVLSGQD